MGTKQKQQKQLVAGMVSYLNCQWTGIESDACRNSWNARWVLRWKMKRLACEVSPIGDHQNACRVYKIKETRGDGELASFIGFYFDTDV